MSISGYVCNMYMFDQIRCIKHEKIGFSQQSRFTHWKTKIRQEDAEKKRLEAEKELQKLQGDEVVPTGIPDGWS